MRGAAPNPDVHEHVEIRRYEIVVRLPLEPVGSIPEILRVASPIAAYVEHSPFADVPQHQIIEFLLAFDEESLTIRWVFDDLYSSDIVNEISHDNAWTQGKRIGILMLPNKQFRWMPREVAVVELVWNMAFAAVARISLLSCRPWLFQSYINTRNYRVGTAEVRCGDDAFAAMPRAFWADANVRSLEVDAAAIRAAAAVPLRDHERFLLAADAAMLSSDLRKAISNLATCVEVAAYQRCIVKCPDHFGPSKFFRGDAKSPLVHWIGDHGRLPSSTFKSVDSLWGTRHEILHNGRLKRRPRAKCAESELLSLGFNDYYEFRKAVVDTLDWLGHALT